LNAIRWADFLPTPGMQHSVSMRRIRSGE